MGNSIITTNNSEVVSYNKEQLKLIKSMYAKNATDDELNLMLYMSQKYNLDILSKQLWCVKFKDGPAQIYAGRDGFLEVAHNSGKFDGMKTEIKRVDEPFEIQINKWENGKKVNTTFRCETQFVATCTVFKIGMSHPIEVQVFEEEYSTGLSLWATKRRTMIGKVAESQCLRKAFSISGLYSPEEMGETPTQIIVDPSKIVGENYGETPTTIDDMKIQSLKVLAEKKGIIQKSICESYELSEFSEMTYEIWHDATEKLELRPDKIEKKTTEKDPLGDF